MATVFKIDSLVELGHHAVAQFSPVFKLKKTWFDSIRNTITYNIIYNQILSLCFRCHNYDDISTYLRIPA